MVQLGQERGNRISDQMTIARSYQLSSCAIG